MTRRSWYAGTLFAAGTAVAAVLAGMPAAGAADSSGVTVLTGGLHGPKEVSLGTDGKLYVAESDLGRISVVDPATGARKQAAGHVGAAGAIDRDGSIFAVKGYVPEAGGSGPGTAPLVKIAPDGTETVVTDLLQYELAHNPDGQDQSAPDALSNPYYVVAYRGGELVADAGANDVLFVDARGTVSTFFAPRNIHTGACAGQVNNDPRHPGCDPVPTGLALGPDGTVYVSGLGGEVPGGARIWKLSSSGEVLRTWGGLSSVTGVAVGPDGTVYASELEYGAQTASDPADIGRVVRITPDGLRRYAPVTMPAGLLMAKGKLYASAWAVAKFVGMPSKAGELVTVAPSAFVRGPTG